MEAVFLIQTNRKDQGTMNAIVYLDLLETSARLTSTSVRHIHVYEVTNVNIRSRQLSEVKIPDMTVSGKFEQKAKK